MEEIKITVNGIVVGTVKVSIDAEEWIIEQKVEEFVKENTEWDFR